MLDITDHFNKDVDSVYQTFQQWSIESKSIF